MQFNNKITAVSNSYNELGERIANQRNDIKCRILNHRVRRVGDMFGTSSDKQEDLKILVPYRKFHPYDALFSDKTMTFFLGDIQYDVISISSINGFAGSTKYYEIDMRQTHV